MFILDLFVFIVLLDVFRPFLLLYSSVNSLVGWFSEVVYIIFVLLLRIGDRCSIFLVALGKLVRLFYF